MNGHEFLDSTVDWEEPALLFSWSEGDRALIAGGPLRFCLIVPATDEASHMVYEISTKSGRTLDHPHVMRLAQIAY